MNLYEFEAKEILAQYGIPLPDGRVAQSAVEAEAVAKAMPGHKFAVKAQIMAGGRGLAGGIQMAATPSQVGTIAGKLLGSRLTTPQTRPEGDLVERVYVETAVESEKDFFLAVLVDQATAMINVLGSAAGGVDFEDRVAKDSTIVNALPVRLDGRIADVDADAFLSGIGFPAAHLVQGRDIMRALVKAFVNADATLIEINPLTLTKDGTLCAVDAKMTLDNNSLFRHPEFTGLQSSAAVDEVEMQAQKDEINLVRLDGNIGVVVNGAGLALATQDMLADAGGKAANFMDIRTTATSLQVARGIGILLADPKVKVILALINR